MQERSTVPGARRWILVEGELLSGNQRFGLIGKFTHSELWTLQISKNTNRPTTVFFDLANYGVSASVIFMSAVTEIQPEHVNTCIEKSADSGQIPPGRSQRAYDFRVASSSH
jgi:hypothetical protein